MSIAFPVPDQAILARREEILRGLAPLVAPEALIVTEDERREVLRVAESLGVNRQHLQASSTR